MVYGNFMDCREGMRTAMYGVISFLTYFVAEKCNGKYSFGEKEKVNIQVYNGVLGEWEDKKAVELISNHGNLYVGVYDNAYSEYVEHYILNGIDDEVLNISSLWNIVDNLYRNFD